MDNDDRAVVGIWAVVLILAAWAGIYAVTSSLDAVTKVMVAVVGGAAVLLGAILTHALTSLREQKIELQRQRQTNYGILADRLVPFVRAPERSDELTQAHLYSWVVGSPEVIDCTGRFVKTRSEDNLRALLVAMRRDIGLVELPPNTRFESSLLQQPKPAGGLEPAQLSLPPVQPNAVSVPTGETVKPRRTFFGSIPKFW